MSIRTNIFIITVVTLSSYYLISCQQPVKSISFYYWKTNFNLDPIEEMVLQKNSVNKLYARFFDVDYLPGDSSPRAISPITFNSTEYKFKIVPVVYIKNRTLERLDSSAVTSLSKKIYSLVTEMNKTVHADINEIQFDCDWTELTRNKYFQFLEKYKQLSGQLISATIRLHQIKYAEQTGIPPVDHGVLMYYNMGEISAGTGNSIYEKSIASKYILSLKTYPLSLDIALPIFSWSQQIRDGKVIKLLNKMNFSHFENDSNFNLIQDRRFLVKHSCFHGGYYFQEKDVVKIEHISEAELLEMASEINRNSNHHLRNLIFYDLDKANLVQYEKSIFRETARRID